MITTSDFEDSISNQDKIDIVIVLMNGHLENHLQNLNEKKGRN